ncbi:hypothetical protein DFH09DRAFT_1100692 [Mycena vulgaris]|nr:hypothetical protein DFH09DRAFT_1100692 [Mycena vulgaris]
MKEPEISLISVGWEPEENFLGTKWALKAFWKRAKLDGRNYKHLKQFKMHEVIQPAEKAVQASNRKPGPGRSSAGLVTGTRVFALWHENNHYYSAVVQRRKGNKYVVQFDEDDSHHVVSLKHMRACADLREDDTVMQKSDVARIWEIKADGSFTIQKELNINSITISGWSIDDEWGDRKLTHKDIVCAKKARV